MPADPTASPSPPGVSALHPARPSLAFRLGRFVQAVVLAVAVAAVVMKLLQGDLELTFRYGGF
jgi:hypothetical protein